MPNKEVSIADTTSEAEFANFERKYYWGEKREIFFSSNAERWARKVCSMEELGLDC